MTGMKPVSEERKILLKVRKTQLQELINTETHLLNALVAHECITKRQKEYIETSKGPPSQRTSLLLDCIERATEQNFLKFLDIVLGMNSRFIWLPWRLGLFQMID